MGGDGRWDKCGTLSNGKGMVDGVGVAPRGLGEGWWVEGKGGIMK